ncbi:MAG: hypothetical protein AB2693_27705, partial [Candidatus Thiodiazotropha sp.]
MHPGDDDQLDMPDGAVGEDKEASLDLSDISAVELEDLGESDSEDMLQQLARANDKAFPKQTSAT